MKNLLKTFIAISLIILITNKIVAQNITSVELKTNYTKLLIPNLNV